VADNIDKSTHKCLDKHFWTYLTVFLEGDGILKSTLKNYNPVYMSLDPRICVEGSCFANLPASILQPGPGQRGEASKLKSMVGEEKYDPIGFRPLSVAHGAVKNPETGKEEEFYFLTDGLQRWTAITRTYGTDVMIPCFIVEGLSEADQKHALYLINHNASIFSDKIKLWQNAVEGKRDPIRAAITKLFLSYGIGIGGYDKDGQPLTKRRVSNGVYFRPGDMLVQYVFGDSGRYPIAGGKDSFKIEFEAVEYALKMITEAWPDDKKKTDDIFLLGLIYFYAKNFSIWSSLEQAVEKSKAAMETRTVDQYVNTALSIMHVKDAIDSGASINSSSRCSSVWHGPAGYLVFKRAYEKRFKDAKKLLYKDYEVVKGAKPAMFDLEKYGGIKKLLYRF